jgi:pyruvate/2-oxoglutarate dehydrogenase complex dihydrolipoamide acyltransferase (E2) component
MAAQSDSTSPTGSGAVSSLARLKRDGGHTLAELQEFLAQMRGRSPQEVLGMVSASELIRGILLATLGCVLLIAVFTVVPYVLRGDQTAANKSNETEPSAAAKKDETTSPGAATPAVATKGDSATAATPDVEAAAKALDIDEVKTANPNVNPLDKDLDKLLDGTE